MDHINVIVQARNVYGREALYPVSPAAQHLASIAGTKTLSRDNLRHAAEMGCTVVVTAGPVLQVA